MHSLMYFKLAANNMRRQSRLYTPYFISSIITIAMLYVMLAISDNSGLSELMHAEYLGALLNCGSVIVGIFSLIFLIYTNSFIIKQRTSEFGLYSVLGMEKLQIYRLIFIETMYSFLISVILGIATGMLFDKLITLILCRMMRFDVVFGFEISLSAVITTVIVFAVIYAFCLIADILKVRKTNAIDMLRSKNEGEREPKTKWLLTVLGIACLSVGYIMALTVKSPVDAISLFFVAVILVIVGTYCLFTSGSIALLKALRKNKKYYYSTRHFTSVSSMIYRMKQNAAGLASICILSTMVLVTVSTTVGLYAGCTQSLIMIYPADIIVTQKYSENEKAANQITLNTSKKSVNDCGLKIKKCIDYSYISFNAEYSGNEFICKSKSDIPKQAEHNVCIINCKDYNSLTHSSLELKNTEAAVCSNSDVIGKTFTLEKKQYDVKTHLNDFPSVGEYSVYTNKNDYIVVSDENELERIHISLQKTLGKINSQPIYEIRLDISGTDEEKIACSKAMPDILQASVKEAGLSSVKPRVNSRQENSNSFYGLYGSFLFLGIIFAILFLMVTAMIIYYKQVSEGYDDRERYVIMQNVGMSHEEVRKSINSQVLTVFFLPLFTAFIHLAFSFPMIKQILYAFNLTDTNVFVAALAATAVVFTVIYMFVYIITSRAYYKIVSVK